MTINCKYRCTVSCS